MIRKVKEIATLSHARFLAGDLEGSAFVTGTTNLITDASKVVIGLGIASAVLVGGFFFLRAAYAGEGERSRHIKSALIGIAIGIGTALVSTIVTLVGSYYQV